MATKRKREPSSHDSNAKLPRLPDGYVPAKRALSHAAIASPASAGNKIVYVSSRMPFMAAVKRVQSLLAAAEKRETQAALDKSRRGRGVDLEAAAELLSRPNDNATEIVLKGTGKVVEKTLSLGLWFQSHGRHKVEVRTGSVGTVDDVVKAEEAEDDDDNDKEGQDAAEVPRSRLRYLSAVEVSISVLR